MLQIILGRIFTINLRSFLNRLTCFSIWFPVLLTCTGCLPGLLSWRRVFDSWWLLKPTVGNISTITKRLSHWRLADVIRLSCTVAVFIDFNLSSCNSVVSSGNSTRQRFGSITTAFLTWETVIQPLIFIKPIRQQVLDSNNICFIVSGPWITTTRKLCRSLSETAVVRSALAAISCIMSHFFSHLFILLCVIATSLNRWQDAAHRVDNRRADGRWHRQWLGDSYWCTKWTDRLAGFYCRWG